MKKTVFIIPGFRHQPQNKPYRAIAKILKEEGYFPILVKIPWDKKTMSENTSSFLKQYKSLQRKEKYILGFSFGAMIAFLASTKVRVSGLILCSLSPYFKEDLKRVHETWDSLLMSQRYKDFSTLHSATLVKKIKAKKIMMLYGSKEEKVLVYRVKKTYRQLAQRKKYLLPILQAGHNIGDQRYLQTIHKVAQGLQF